MKLTEKIDNLLEADKDQLHNLKFSIRKIIEKSKLIDKHVKGLGIHSKVAKDYAMDTRIKHKSNILSILWPNRHSGTGGQETYSKSQDVADAKYISLAKEMHKEVKKHLAGMGITKFMDDSIDGLETIFVSDDLSI